MNTTLTPLIPWTEFLEAAIANIREAVNSDQFMPYTLTADFLLETRTIELKAGRQNGKSEACIDYLRENDSVLLYDHDSKAVWSSKSTDKGREVVKLMPKATINEIIDIVLQLKPKAIIFGSVSHGRGAPHAKLINNLASVFVNHPDSFDKDFVFICDQ